MNTIMQRNKIFAAVAQEKLSIPTLETQGDDVLDFHELPVWAIREALRAAFEAGAEAAFDYSRERLTKASVEAWYAKGRED